MYHQFEEPVKAILHSSIGNPRQKCGHVLCLSRRRGTSGCIDSPSGWGTLLPYRRRLPNDVAGITEWEDPHSTASEEITDSGKDC